MLAIPPKRFDRRTIDFLTADESQALINATPLARWEGRRDRAMLTLALHTGLRVSELTALDCRDVHLQTGPHVR